MSLLFPYLILPDAVVDFTPLKGAALIEMNPTIASLQLLIDCWRNGEYKDKLREPTEIENSIIEKVFKK